MENIINAFRKDNGYPPVEHWDDVVRGYCKEHSVAMAFKEELYHASDYHLNEWSEAIAYMDFGVSWNMGPALIYDVLGKSPNHREILLRSSIMACGLVTTYRGIWLTIRGK